jgi:ABC-type Na+ efflux pump permease subunit
MIHNILLVAMREFRQITGMRSFWLTLLILPIALAIGPIATKLMGSDKVQRSRSGGSRGALGAARPALRRCGDNGVREGRRHAGRAGDDEACGET